MVPGARLLVLSEDGATPSRIRDLLAEMNLAASRLVVLEAMGGPSERITEGVPADCAPLNLVAVEVRGARTLAVVPGLPDDAFLHDGQLTKREVRAVTLSALAPLPGEVLWDIGAGCGSVAIEWMRAGGKAVAIEPKSERAERIARNAIRLGVPGLELLQGSAPGLLPDGAPDAVFVGGGVSEPGLLELCWSRLAPGGRLVANAVTAEGEAALLACHGKFGGELTRIAVSRLKAIGGFHTWAPALPVTQYVGWKP
jgi:precorrin-6Y C5,15-methyltransferase (decarboxylating)